MALRNAMACMEGGRVNRIWCMGAISHSYYGFYWGWDLGGDLEHARQRPKGLVACRETPVNVQRAR